jgi:NDP-sugar pyrophosphorylase family protein
MNNLVILAAGLGSRFGGNKQLAEFGQQHLTLMEYNLKNAINAGISRVVFVIRPELALLLKKQVIPRLPKNIEYAVVFQSLDDLPHGCSVSTHRTKPLGTAHALWSCRNIINDSFAVINADDFYGKQAFKRLFAQAKKTPTDYLMVAYQLQNTLSDFGGVNRGLCQIDEHQYLVAIEECKQIKADREGINGLIGSNKLKIKLPAESLISMNFWFFTTDIFNALEQAIVSLLKSEIEQSAPPNTECYLPAVVMQQIQQQKKKVFVLSTEDTWFGLTYPQDTVLVNEKVTALYGKKG